MVPGLAYNHCSEHSCLLTDKQWQQTLKDPLSHRLNTTGQETLSQEHWREERSSQHQTRGHGLSSQHSSLDDPSKKVSSPSVVENPEPNRAALTAEVLVACFVFVCLCFQSINRNKKKCRQTNKKEGLVVKDICCQDQRSEFNPQESQSGRKELSSMSWPLTLPPCHTCTYTQK